MASPTRRTINRTRIALQASVEVSESDRSCLSDNHVNGFIIYKIKLNGFIYKIKLTKVKLKACQLGFMLTFFSYLRVVRSMGGCSDTCHNVFLQWKLNVLIFLLQ